MTGGNLKEDIGRDPRALEHEAGRARVDVERTLEILEHRLSPTALVSRAMAIVRENGGEFGRNLATQVRNNPVPTVLAGLGIAWLAAASDRPPRTRQESSGGRSVGERMSSAAGSMSSAAASARETTQHAARGARAAAREAASISHGAASNAAHASRATASSIRDGYSYLRREQPLVLGVLAVAAGAAIGALLPSTDTEDEWLGSASDEAADRLREEGRRQVETVRAKSADVAEAATEAATEAVRREPGARRDDATAAGSPGSPSQA